MNSNVAPICFARGRTTMRPAQFLSCVGLVLLFCAAPLLASGALLLRLGEFEDPDSIGRQLIKYDGLYGTAVNSNVGDVKLSLTAHLKPDVVVLGSSRSLQFRDIMFDICECWWGYGRTARWNQLSEAYETPETPQAFDSSIGSLVVSRCSVGPC